MVLAPFLFAEENLYFSPVFFAGVRLDEADSVPGKHKARAFRLYEYQVLTVSGAGVAAQNIAGLGVRKFLHFGQKRIGA
jgi:hypothetical protein